VGVLFDDFRAPDASTAAAVLERCAGPKDPHAAVLDAVAGKGFEPEVMLRKLQSLLTGVSYDELPEGELLATEGEDGPWIVQLSEELRDAWRTRSPAGCRRLPSSGCAPRSSGNSPRGRGAAVSGRGHRPGASCAAGR
jgi:hypothetical protein